MRTAKAKPNEQGYRDHSEDNPGLKDRKEHERQDRHGGGQEVCKQHPECLLQGIERRLRIAPQRVQQPVDGVSAVLDGDNEGFGLRGREAGLGEAVR